MYLIEKGNYWTNMKTLLLSLFALGCQAQAQSLTLTLTPPSPAPGTTATLAVGFVDSNPSSNAVAVEFSLSAPAMVVFGTPTLGAASTATGKQIYCGVVKCLISDTVAPFNLTPLANGVLATYPVTISASASGPQTITLTSFGGANSTSASSVSFSVSPLTFTPAVVLSKYDLNGDGVVDIKDVLLAVLQAIGTNPCQLTGQGAGDVNGDGFCDSRDPTTIGLAILGLIAK